MNLNNLEIGKKYYVKERNIVNYITSSEYPKQYEWVNEFDGIFKCYEDCHITTGSYYIGPIARFETIKDYEENLLGNLYDHAIVVDIEQYEQHNNAKVELTVKEI